MTSDWNYVVLDSEGEPWAWTDSFDEAIHYHSQEPGGSIRVTIPILPFFDETKLGGMQ